MDVYVIVLDTLLALLLAFVNVPAPTDTEHAPSCSGVNVAVYVVPLPAKVEFKLPLLTVTSDLTKFVVATLAVNSNATVLLWLPP